MYVLCTDEDALLSKDIHTSTDSSFFIIDSGASAHMCHDQSYYSSYRKIIPPKPIWIADDCVIDAVGIGDICIQTHQGRHTNSGLIKGVLHLPKLCMSLLSTTKLADARVGTKSSPQHLDLINIHTGRLMDRAHRVQNLYKLQVDIICSNELHLTQTHPPAKAPLALWHC